MITCISLNPSIDRTLTVDSFTKGELNRVLSSTDVAAGKGINVAITAAAMLGVETECIGFMYRESEHLFEKRLLTNGVACDFVLCEGSARTNIKVLDRSAGVVTELNESGRAVSENDLQAMTDLFARHAEMTDYMVLSGSLPPGCPQDYYRTLLEAADGLGCRCILDADGPRLVSGLEARPFMIKPNRYEMEMLIGEKLTCLQDVRKAALRFIDQGVQTVVVTLGSEGAFITDGAQFLFAPGLKAEICSTVGAGDAMAAAMAAGFMGDASLEETFRMGVACATARCITDSTRPVDRQTYHKVLDMVRVQNV